MSCFETARELFLHSAQGGTTAPGDVTNAVARHLDATHPHRGLNQKSEELSTGHEQHLSSVQRDQREIRTPQITNKTYHEKSIGPLGPVFTPPAEVGAHALIQCSATSFLSKALQLSFQNTRPTPSGS